MQKKILIVVESIDIEESSGSKANVALIRNIHKLGFELRVFHYTRKNINIPGINCISVKEDRKSSLFFLSRIERYLRIYLKIQVNKHIEKVFGFSFTLFNDRNSIIKGIKGINDFLPDLVITLSQGGRFRPHHALLKMPEYHKKWVAYIHDPYPMHLYPRPYAWVEPGYLPKWKFMKEISQKAAVNAFPSKLLMEWMGSYFPDYKEKGIIIPHQMEKYDVSQTIIPDYFDPEKFNILHAGNLLWGRDPEGLIEGFKKFLATTPGADNDACLMFLGGRNHYSTRLNEYSGEISQLLVSDTIVPFEEVNAMQSKSAVNVILEAKSEISPFLPGKFAHCVSANKQILLLGPYYSEAKRLLGSDYKYWAEIDDIDAIANYLGNIYRKWKLDIEQVDLKRPDLEKYLSLDYLERTMNTIFEKV